MEPESLYTGFEIMSDAVKCFVGVGLLTTTGMVVGLIHQALKKK